MVIDKNFPVYTEESETQPPGQSSRCAEHVTNQPAVVPLFPVPPS